jgi:ankyrin repeat protein
MDIDMDGNIDCVRGFDLYYLSYKPLNQIQYLINRGLDIKAFDNRLIRDSIIRNKLETTAFLLDLVNMNRQELAELLVLCCNYTDNIEIVKLLQRHGGDINYVENGISLLARTIRNNNMNISHYLLDCNVNIHSMDLTFSIYFSKVDIFKRLMEYPMNKEERDKCIYTLRTPNNVPPNEDYEEKFLEMLKIAHNDYDVDCFKYNNYLFRYSVLCGHYKIVYWFIELGIDIHVDNDFALVWSAYGGHLSIVRLLLDNGAYINPLGNENIWASNNILKIYTNEDHCRIINNAPQYIPLTAASLNKKWDVCRLLIEYGSDPKIIKSLVSEEEYLALL